MATTVKALDETAPLIVMAALLEQSASVTSEHALVSVGDTLKVDNEDGYLRWVANSMHVEFDSLYGDSCDSKGLQMLA